MRTSVHRLWVLTVYVIVVASNLRAQSGTWTWVKGSNQTNPPAVYGTQGVPNSANTPQGFYEAAYWIDLQGNFWIFGGLDDNHSATSDLWRYEPLSNTWTWMKGPGNEDDPGIYGTQGIPSQMNNPPARGFGSSSWTDKNGDLWLFGGYCEISMLGDGSFNDLWRYRISTNEWTWMKGANLANQPDNYSNLGVFSGSATPGGRCENSAQWVDENNGLWFFGGQGNLSACYNDMWCYNVASNQWAWMSGPQGPASQGNYGIEGVESAYNLPHARATYTRWKDNLGNFYFFGGEDFGSGMGYSDVWRYNTANNYWTWLAGDSIPWALGDTAMYCKYNGSFGPCARCESRTAQLTGCARSLLTFGGFSVKNQLTPSDTPASLNDLWLFDISNNQWKLLSGPANYNGIGNYGTKGIASVSNLPPSRGGACMWVDGDGNFWLFGGMTEHLYYAYHYNDVWKYTPDQNCLGALPPGQLITSKLGSTICSGDSTLLSFNAAANVKISPAENVAWVDSSHVYLITDSTTTFTIIGQTYCGIDTQVFALYALPGVHAAFTINPPDVTIARPIVNLSNQSTGYSSFNWFMDSSTVLFGLDNTLQFSDTGIYCIGLAAANSAGCADTAIHCVDVSPLPLIAVPGAFSPNGDGVNDYFTVFGKNLGGYSIRIFNRWGEVVYFSSNPDELNNLGRGWDGTYKGKLQDAGTFVYTIIATDAGGNKIEKKGDLILIR